MNKKIIIGLFGAAILAGSAQAMDNDQTIDNDYSHWLVRLRAISVMPITSTNVITPIGGQINASNQIVPELDFSYFFTPKIAAELILGTSRNSVTATNTTLGNVNLGKVSLLPPTLTLQYHFLPNSRFNPYVGAGINYTYFYDIQNGPLLSSTNYGDSFGPALQIGTDIALSKSWLFNIDVKKLFVTSHVTTMSGSTLISTNAALNPWIVGAGFGYRF